MEKLVAHQDEIERPSVRGHDADALAAQGRLELGSARRVDPFGRTARKANPMRPLCVAVGKVAPIEAKIESLASRRALPRSRRLDPHGLRRLARSGAHSYDHRRRRSPIRRARAADDAEQHEEASAHVFGSVARVTLGKYLAMPSAYFFTSPVK